MPTRIRAAEVAVEKGMGSKVRSWAADMKTEDRNELLAGLIRELLDHMDKRDDEQYASKDALLLLERYIAPDQFTGLQEKIAAWAFGDWTWDLSSEDVKKKLESRMSTGQIRDLGPYGWKGGAILISHGYVVDKMLEMLTAADQPEATDLMLKGLRKYHTNIGVRASHLDALSKTKSSDAAIYVLDLYMDKNQDNDIQIMAFAAAAALLDKEVVRKKGGEALVGRLFKMMEGTSAEDRWLGAAQILRIDGVKQIGPILERFKDDIKYNQDQTLAVRSVTDFCLDIRDKYSDKGNVALFKKQLAGTNRIAKAIGVYCLKSIEAHDASSALVGVTRQTGKYDMDLGDVFESGYTMAGLAKNAVEGLALMAAADKDKKLNDQQKKDKKQCVVYSSKELGPELVTAVDACFAPADAAAAPAAPATK
jgi:hypothetical protein